MQNNRPVNNPDIQYVLNEFQRLCRYYDLAGTCTVLDAQESGFTYALYTTWNAVIEDDSLPMGFRIRLKTAEQGAERAQALAEGTAWTFGALLDFGTQTRTWGHDMLTLLRQAGMNIVHTPFGGAKLPRLRGQR